MKTSQVVIITGGARGIGFGIAQCFAAEKASIVIVDLDGGGAEQAARRLREEGAPAAVGVRCDITSEDDVAGMVDRAVQEFGRIDVLVNNAGICPFVDVLEMDTATWRKTIDVNLTGAYFCTKAVARRMIDQGAGGRIVFITSLAENVTGPAQVDYAASKAGLRMAMRGFATALGKYGITCNAVAPGMILTDMTRHYWEQPGPAEEIKRRVPMGRIGTPTDVGHAVVFLASPQAEYISGVTITVDGGHQAVCA